MGSKMRDLLTAFSPSLDYLAISSGDGRIKIWDTVKYQLQMEFSDIASTKENSRFIASEKFERGHLSLDYTCMAWLSSDKKKKRKLVSPLLVLGTGSGDILAFDVFAGHLKWTFSDCHPGGVRAISYDCLDSCIYTAGADKTICKLESQSGNLKEKFYGSSKEISSISVSPDGKLIAIASAQLKISSCTDHRRLQKFSGHRVAVRSTCFSDDGKFILSCGSGERYVALWSVDESKNRSSICLLAMEHPAVSIDCKISEKEQDDSCFCVLALSEVGECYVWYGRSIEELRSSNPGKISLSSENSVGSNNEGSLPLIFTAKLMGHLRATEVPVFVSYGLVVKPLYQKIVVKPGQCTMLHISQEGLLLPLNRVEKPSKSVKVLHGVTALDSSNVDDALLPTTKISEIRNRSLTTAVALSQSSDVDEDYSVDVGTPTFSMELQLRQLEVVRSVNSDALSVIQDFASSSDFNPEASASLKKMRAAILSMDTDSALNLLEGLIMNWESRNYNAKSVLPWIRNILFIHGHHIMANGILENHVLGSLSKISKSRCTAIQQLLQLSGRLQLVAGQIDKASVRQGTVWMQDQYTDEEDSDAEEHIYGEDESELSSDDDV